MSNNAKPSWSLNLIAGSQTDSPDFMAVTPLDTPGAGQGKLTVAAQKVVYSETSMIRFASGGDTVINEGPLSNYMITSAMKYSLATYSGMIRGNVEGDLTISPGGAIQSATGSIDIRTGGGLYLGKNTSYLGTIRTTGEHAPSKQTTDYDTYGHGGILISILGEMWRVASPAFG
jgi:hypothetical protein